MKSQNLKRVFFLLLCLCILITSSVYVKGMNSNILKESFFKSEVSHNISLEKFESPKPFEVKNLKNIGTITVKETLVIDGVQNDLFCTFDDPNSALIDLIATIPDYLNLLEKKFSLEPISLDRLNLYEEKMWEYEQMLIDTNAIEELESVREKSKILASFCRVYRCDEQNKTIIEKSLGDVNLKRSASSLEYDDLVELSTLLPYFTPLAEELDAMSIVASRSVINGFDRYAGSQYAIKHATSRNWDYYSFSNGDCTNFTSQILEAGGVKQVVYNDVNLGWWHKRVAIHPVGHTHTHSKSWTVAGTFCSYMGRSGKTKSLNVFSGQLVPGDFIALDEDGIGNFHHLGFVTYTGTYNTYNGKYYKDFRVAQHTTDYHEWVSSPINGWENSDGSGMYCVVRRMV